MNLNEFAQKVAQREGGKAQVNIAQIKEVINCVFDVIILEGHGSSELINALMVEAVKRQAKEKKEKDYE